MTVKIICCGKLKESYLIETVNDYKKRLSRFVSVEILEAADEKIPENASAAEEAIALNREGERILSKIQPSDYVIAMAIQGSMYTSESFSEHVQMLFDSGKNTLVFLIGGSLGLSDAVYKRANEKISLSKMTFPHRIARILILEQLYRAFKISHHEPYHK